MTQTLSNLDGLPKPKQPVNSTVRVNKKIIASVVDLRDDPGKKLGIQTLKKALLFARWRKLDLVEIDPKTIPPVCLVIDFGKYMFLMQKGKIPKE